MSFGQPVVYAACKLTRRMYFRPVHTSIPTLTTQTTDPPESIPHIYPYIRAQTKHKHSLSQCPAHFYTQTPFSSPIPTLQRYLHILPHTYNSIHPCLKNLLSRNLFFRGFITDDDLCQTPIIKASLQPRLLQNQSLAQNTYVGAKQHTDTHKNREEKGGGEGITNNTSLCMCA